jgi:hypothetical protein
MKQILTSFLILIAVAVQAQIYTNYPSARYQYKGVAVDELLLPTDTVLTPATNVSICRQLAMKNEVLWRYSCLLGKWVRVLDDAKQTLQQVSDAGNTTSNPIRLVGGGTHPILEPAKGLQLAYNADGGNALIWAGDPTTGDPVPISLLGSTLHLQTPADGSVRISDRLFINDHSNTDGQYKGLVLGSTGGEVQTVTRFNTSLLGSGTANNTTFLRGDGTWQPLSIPTYTASNGLNMVGNDVRLGGTLTASTTINAGGNDFTLTRQNQSTNNTSRIQLQDAITLQTQVSGTGRIAEQQLTAAGAVFLRSNNNGQPGQDARLTVDGTGISTLGSFNIGSDDASTGAYKLLTRNNSTGRVETVPSSTFVSTASNGLTASASNVKLGGTLIDPTTSIGGNNTNLFVSLTAGSPSVSFQMQPSSPQVFINAVNGSMTGLQNIQSSGVTTSSFNGTSPNEVRVTESISYGGGYALQTKLANEASTTTKFQVNPGTQQIFLPNYTNTASTDSLLTTNNAGRLIMVHKNAVVTNYWTASGNNIYNNNTANVGIGTTNPLFPLHVFKSTSPLVEVEAGNNGSNATFGTIAKTQSGNSLTAVMRLDGADSTFKVNYRGVNEITIDYNNNINLTTNVGINQPSPTSRLDVTGATGYNQLRLRTTYTPTSSADANGNVGDIAWDANYIYVKTASGWKRTALTTF